MLRFLNIIDYKKISHSLFLTLTWPDECLSMDYSDRTMQRNVFMRHLEKEVGRQVPAIWRIEWEERKSGMYTGDLAPHLHLMVFNVRYISWQRVRELWRQSIRRGSGVLKTWVKGIYNEDGACRYLSKYVSKYRSLDVSSYLNSGIKFGKHWDVCREGLIPLRPVEADVILGKKQVQRVLNFAASKWPWYDKNTPHGFTIFGERDAKSWKNWLNSTCDKG